ncbi:MAG: phosphotransferase, partial [Bizionia sp.]|nr:phosphotransferase [Bizionia sp.]
TMTQIPAISSILSPKHIAEYIRSNYGFYANTKCSILKTGINHSYLINTASKKFVFRVYCINWRTRLEIEEELKLLLDLKENGTAVSYPINDSLGHFIQTVKAPEGERFAVLFSYAEGETIRNLSEKNCSNLGRAMAKMHQFTKDKTVDRKQYSTESLVGWAFRKAKGRFLESSYEMNYFAEANKIISIEFKQADSSKIRQGVVHLDLWYENMKVVNDTEFIFFDFDNCGNGWLFLDIAYSLMLIFRNEPNKDTFKKKLNSFYKGYESIIAVSTEEKRLVPYGGLAIWLHYTGVHVERYNDFANHFLSEDFLKYWIQTVDGWMHYNAIEILIKSKTL